MDKKMMKWQMTTLATMYLGYAGFMLCRNTLIASSAAMMQDPTLGLDKEMFGQLMSYHSAGAIVGKFVTGIGADLLGGRRMFIIALALTAAANAGFAMFSSFFFFGVFNFFGQFFKAGGWPAMAKIIGVWYPENKYGRVWSIISTSSRVGTIAAGLVLGFFLTMMSWRSVFWLSAAITGAIVILAYFFLKNKPEEVGLGPPGETPNDVTKPAVKAKAHPFDGLKLPQAILAFAKSPRFWFISFSIAFLTILMDFINFIPIYLSETLNVAASSAAMAGSAFPSGMFVALIATSVFYDRFSKKQLIGVLGGLLVLSCFCVLGLWNLGAIPVDPSMHLYIAMGLIFVFGFCISPSYYVPMSVFSIAFGGRHSGFLIALIDVFGYLGAMVFNFFGGSIAQRFGWSVFLTGLEIITILALVCMGSFLYLDYRKEQALQPAN